MKNFKNVFKLVFFVLLSLQCYNLGYSQNNKIVYTGFDGSVYVKEANSKCWRVHELGTNMNVLIPELTKTKVRNIVYTNFEGKTFEPFKSNEPSQSAVNIENNEIPFLVSNYGNGNFVISTKHKSGAVNFELINQLGTVVRNDKNISHEFEFNVSSLAKGIYFIKIFINDQVFTHKILNE